MPLCEAVQQLGQLDSTEVGRIPGKIPGRACEEGARAYKIAVAVMMKSDCDLDQPLKELLFRFRRSAPNVLQYLVGLKKRRPVKQ